MKSSSVSEFVIKVSNCHQRGEYPGGKTKEEALAKAQAIANHCDGNVRVVRFRFGKDLPEDGKLEEVARVPVGEVR